MKVTECSVKRQGTGKNGKPYVIYTIALDDGRSADSFNKLNVGDEVDASSIKETSFGLSIEAPRKGGYSSPSQSVPQSVLNKKELLKIEALKAAATMTAAFDKEKDVIDVAETFLKWLEEEKV